STFVKLDWAGGNTGENLFNVRRSTFSVRCWMLDVGCSMFDVRCSRVHKAKLPRPAALQFSQPKARCLSDAPDGPGAAQSNTTLYMAIHSLDLTKQPPRSPRVRLGGYVILPRCLDKGRAAINGKVGEYHYACPLDQHFLDFAGVDPEAMKKELAAGKGDGEILEWIQ